MPEVAATAAPVHSTAAPGYVEEPAITPVTPWVYLSSCGPGTGQRAATSSASKPRTSVPGRLSPISISSTSPQSASACTGLSPPKVTVSAACTAGPVIAPVATSMPLGMSTATTGGPPRLFQSGDPLGRRRSQRARAGDAHHSVDNEIGCRRDIFDETAARFPERCQPLAVGAVRVEKYRVGGHAATA